MKILVIGGGGREHALVWALARAGHEVLAAPGNGGVAGRAECLALAAHDQEGLVAAARDRGVDLVVVGPEAPLVAGLADRLRAAGVAVFGPDAAAARLEGSKVFCKRFLARHGVPTARFFACTSMAEAEIAIATLAHPDGPDGPDRGVVVKADGLAAGKGTFVCESVDTGLGIARDLLERGRLGAAGRAIVVEERLLGRELSVMAITDGRRLEIWPAAEDHKPLLDRDQGPNTGGMGALSPCPWLAPETMARIEREVLEPTLVGLAAEGLEYRGALYAGLLIDERGAPRVLEYNCRFGDPELQVLLARARSDLAGYLAGAARGRLPDAAMEWDPRSALCVVLCSAGYPHQADTGAVIRGLAADGTLAAGHEDAVMVFHAGTTAAGGAYVTAGGRVLGVTALGHDLRDARERAYRAADTIEFAGMHMRRDIGARAPEPDLADAVAALERGDIVCMPTESSWGLAVDAFDPAALARLADLKGRADHMPFALIAADAAQAAALARVWPERARMLAARHWPGPLTLVVPARPELAPEIVGPGGGVGVRVSSHPVPVALARALGRAITATSANPSGAPAALDLAQARAYFGDRVVYVDAGASPGGQASTVVEISDTGEMRVIRSGPIDPTSDHESA